MSEKRIWIVEPCEHGKYEECDRTAVFPGSPGGFAFAPCQGGIPLKTRVTINAPRMSSEEADMMKRRIEKAFGIREPSPPTPTEVAQPFRDISRLLVNRLFMSAAFWVVVIALNLLVVIVSIIGLVSGVTP